MQEKDAHLLRSLPLLCQVAVAVRCAARVRPLAEIWPHPPEMRDALDNALAFASDVACGKLSPPAPQLGSRVQAARHAVKSPAPGLATRAIQAAFLSAEAVWLCHEAKIPEECDRQADVVLHRTAEAMAVATRAAGLWGIEWSHQVREEIAHDLSRLAMRSRGRVSILGLPIDPSDAGRLGKLWRHGPPPGTPGRPSEAKEPKQDCPGRVSQTDPEWSAVWRGGY